MSGFRRWKALLLDALLPPLCLYCGKRLADARPALCGACRAEIVPLASGGCRRCGLPRPGEPAECARCRAWPEGLTALAATGYAGAAEAVVQAIKYGGWRHLSEPCADMMAQALAARGVRPDVLVPVPLHPTRLRARGFNQAALLARALGERLDRPVSEALARVRYTPPQVGLGRASRAANVAGAFRAFSPLRAGECAGLVDDVATSGATLAAAAAALKGAGTARIVGITFALASGGLSR